MQIRLYQKSDRQNVINFIDNMMKAFDERVTEEMDRDLFDVERYYANGRFWVLEDEGKIMGTLGVSRIDDSACKFRRFYVDESLRGKGFGTQMYGFLEDFARDYNYKEIRCSTSLNHTAMLNFLEKHGFVKSETPLWKARRAHDFFIKKL